MTRLAESRVLDMIDELNVADHYIFLFQFGALFQNEDRQELPADLDEADEMKKALRAILDSVAESRKPDGADNVM